MSQNEESNGDAFGSDICTSCVILLLSILLHVQYGVGLPVLWKGQVSRIIMSARPLNIVGINSGGMNGATVEMKTCNISV